MTDFKSIIAKLATGASLSADESFAAFDMLLEGKTTPAQTGAFLMALRVRGETICEITGAVTAMRSKMLAVNAPANSVDVVGTGGDNIGTYNISTLASFIVASCGVPVAKHGNRAASSKSGAADVLEGLGVNTNQDALGVEHCLAKANLGFMFAPMHHPAMKHVGAARSELGIRTIFNILGPLSNPAGVKHQMIGTFSRDLLLPMAQVLRDLGSEKAWIVHGSDGLDEITTTGVTHVVELHDGKIREFDIAPEDVGLPRACLNDLRGGDAAHNADALKAVLNGAKNAYRDIAVLNSAAALVVAGAVGDLKQGVTLAEAALDSGATLATFEKMVAASREAKLNSLVS
jgi:anthranilate phosphoribosyltransferase